jgi:hypothetical protein
MRVVHYIYLTAVLCFALPCALAVPQLCGTSIYGGTVANGNYQGASNVGPRACEQNLNLAAGAQKPTCDDCAAMGCKASTTVNGPGWTQTHAFYNPITGFWTCAGTATGGTASWDKVCSSCH